MKILVEVDKKFCLSYENLLMDSVHCDTYNLAFSVKL